MSDTDEKDPKDPKDPKEPADPKDPPADKDWEAEANKWKALARKHEAKAKENADAAEKLAQSEEAEKTEVQKATDRAAAAEKSASQAEAKALRLEVALEKAPGGMELAKVRKLADRLTGDSREDLESDAEELFADFAPDTGDDDERVNRRPKERLRSGSVPDAEPEETDPEKLAAQVPRMY